MYSLVGGRVPTTAASESIEGGSMEPLNRALDIAFQLPCRPAPILTRGVLLSWGPPVVRAPHISLE